MNVMRTVGSSTEMVGRGSGASRAQTVSPIDTSPRPVTAQMSPATTSSAATRAKLSYTKASVILPGRGFSSGLQTMTVSPLTIDPDVTRPIAMRPLCSS